MIKILNLYAGIGGNRKHWNKLVGEDIEVTAVEWDAKIAEIYKNNFPDDIVVIADAHKYLLDHYKEFDFIWASPPCPSHSRVRKALRFKKKKDGTVYEQNKPIYPDMTLYEEIIFLDNFFEGYYCVENVIPYYDPLIEPQKLGRHCFWANFDIGNKKFEPRGSFDKIDELSEKLGFDLSNYTGIDKKRLLRNCVEPEVGEEIFKRFLEIKSEE